MIVADETDRAYELKLTRVQEVCASHAIDCPEAAASYWRNHIEKRCWFQSNKEHLVTLLLNTRHKIIGHNLVGIGSLNECTAHPRDILAPVICAAAYAFLLMHNHPSGDPSPSQADRTLTKRVKEGSELLGVPLEDHLIMGNPEFFSFREMGLI